jgi:hypothetical protein
MPMSKAIHDALSEKLVDAKVSVDGKEISLIDLVVQYQDKAEYADKVKTINEEFKAEKAALKEKLDSVTATIAQKDEEIKRIQGGMLSDEDKAKFESFKKSGGVTPEVEAKMNKLADDLKTALAQMDSLVKENTEAKQQAAESKKAALSEQLKTTVLTALQEKGIVGENARIAWNDIRAEGLADLVESETGISQTFVIKKDGKPLSANVAELADHYALTHQSLVKPSGNQGSGHDHQPNNNEIDSFNGLGLQGLKEKAADEMFMTS